ncbi:hypothetical protein [Anthocerotibacter panamensis]|nr:hypothetical protein [Anthocerotibacter panamensis]
MTVSDVIVLSMVVIATLGVFGGLLVMAIFFQIHNNREAVRRR